MKNTEKMHKLIGMTDFVLDQHKYTNWNSYNLIENYANFLKQPLELWMFMPCDDNGNVLEEPIKYKNWTNYDYSGTDIGFEDEKLCRKYQQAKERCLFEGFGIIDMHVENQTWKNVVSDEISINVFWFSKERKKWELSKGIKIIEDLSKYNHLKLTPTAIKKIGLFIN